MNRTPLLPLILASLLSACGESPPPPAPASPPTPPVPTVPAIPEADLYVLAVGGNGFSASMGLADLRARYGAEHVREEAVPLGEGDSEPGALIHGDDPARRAYVHFVGADPKATISAIHLRDPESKWTGPLGLRMGHSSIDLERYNGKPFRFLGFGWDYGGFVSDWTDGTLARAFLEPGRLAVRLAPPELAEGSERPDGYPQGDGEFASDIPPVRAQPPVVVEFGLAFVPADASDATTPAPPADNDAATTPAQ